MLVWILAIYFTAFFDKKYGIPLFLIMGIIIGLYLKNCFVEN